MDLKDYRQEINRLDEEILALFARRMAVAAAIGDYKKAHGLPVLDESREREKLADVAAALPEELGKYGRELYETMFRVSRAYQEERNRG